MTTQPLGRRVIHLDRVESTQTVAADLAHDPAQHGLVVRAEEQTAGRGRRGAVWMAPPGGCLMFSLLLFPPPLLRRPSTVTVLAAVSVADVLREAKQEPTLKWPNDVLLGGKKLSGILVETFGEAVVLGIGLNVNMPQSFFDLADLPAATSLLAQAGAPWNVETLFQSLLRRLDGHYEALALGDSHGVEERWQRYLGLMDLPVEAETTNGCVTGALRTLTLSAMRIEEASGRVRELAPESVLHLRAV